MMEGPAGVYAGFCDGYSCSNNPRPLEPLFCISVPGGGDRIALIFELAHSDVRRDIPVEPWFRVLVGGRWVRCSVCLLPCCLRSFSLSLLRFRHGPTANYSSTKSPIQVRPSEAWHLLICCAPLCTATVGFSSCRPICMARQWYQLCGDRK